MSTTTVGPRYPGTFARSGGWSNDTRMGADDASYATCAPGATDAYMNDYVSGFSFSSDSIPSNAVITEFTVAGEWYGSATGCGFAMQAKTAQSGGTNRGGYQTDANRTSVYALSATYTTNLPTVAELTASSFCVIVGAAGRSKTISVDYIRLSAKYYTPATCTTSAATSVTATTATVAGETTDDGSGTISARGVCYNTSGSPTIADLKVASGSGIGTFSCNLTGLWASSTYYARSYATTEDGTAYGNQVQFTTLGSGSKSLVARPFTTRAAAAESVVRTGEGIIDWWVEDGVARAEVRPTAVADIPRDRWYVVSRDTAGTSVSLTMDSEDTLDVICVVYRTYGVTNVRDGTVRRVYSPATPTSAIQRVQLVDLTGQYMGESDAETYAANVLARVSADVMTATISVRGGLYTVDGAWRPAPLILAGDWVDVVDLPGHVPTYVTGTTYSRAENMVTITTGNQEQNELIVPGISALPQALQVYGQDTAYERYTGDDPGGDPGGGGGYDPGLSNPVRTEGALGETPYTPGQITLPSSGSGYDHEIWGPAANDPDWEPYSH